MTDTHKARCGCEIHESGTENEVVFMCPSHKPDYGKFLIYESGAIQTEPVISVCSTCCACRTISEWINLEHIGNMNDGGGGQLELRNCVCGSTISIPVGS